MRPGGRSRLAETTCFKTMNFDERIARFLGKEPAIHPTAFVAEGATIVGDVTIAEQASVWFGCVLRADINQIVIGPSSNIQDGSVVHLADDFGTFVGQFVTVGHRAILHACMIGDEVLIGMGAIVLDGAEIGPRSIIGANAVVTQGAKIPSGSMVLGTPGKVVRSLALDEQAGLKAWAERYVQLSRVYRERVAGGTLPAHIHGSRE